MPACAGRRDSARDSCAAETAATPTSADTTPSAAAAAANGRESRIVAPVWRVSRGTEIEPARAALHAAACDPPVDVSWLFEHQPEWVHGCPGRTGRDWRDLLPARARARLGHPRVWTLVATVLGSSMAFIDASVVNVALPTIGRDLQLGLSGREWIFLSYSLALASLYLVGGAAGDRLGQRRGVLARGVPVAGAAPF